MLGDRLPKRQDAERLDVAGAAVFQGLLGRFADDRRRVEVGLAELEMNDVDPLTPERLCPITYLHGEEGLDPLHPWRWSHRRHPTRSRAAVICRNIPGPLPSTRTLLPG